VNYSDTPINIKDVHQTTDCYWEGRPTGLIINESVQEQIRNIRKHNKIPEPNVAINQAMKVAVNCLSIDPKRRPKAGSLCESLKAISDKVISPSHTSNLSSSASSGPQLVVS
jgi:hypothetical protein